MRRSRVLLAVGPGRPSPPTCTRISGIRNRSQLVPGDRETEDSGSLDSRPPPEREPPFANQSFTRRTRQQRASQISDEVQMLSRSVPPANVRGAASPYPTIRSRGVDAEAVGRSPGGFALGGQMGANVSEAQEGPGAQDVDDQGNMIVNRAKEVTAQMNDRGAIQLEGVGEQREGEVLEEEEDDDDDEQDQDGGGYSTQHELALLEQFDKEDITPVPFEPEPVTRDAYLKLGQGGSLIVGNNFEGVIEDRLKLLAERTQDGFRWPPEIAARMMKGGFVSFKDEAEKAAVVAAAGKYAQKRADAKARQSGREAGEVEKPEFEFAPIAQKSQDAVFDRLVRGAYGDLDAAPHKHDVLNHVVRNLMRNGSYLADDQAKLLKKVRSLLPAQTGARTAPRK